MSRLARLTIEARQLAQGKHIPGVSTIDGGFRRVKTTWLACVALRLEALESALRTLVDDWDSVDPKAPVPDEINVDAHWAAARDILGVPQPD